MLELLRVLKTTVMIKPRVKQALVSFKNYVSKGKLIDYVIYQLFLTETEITIESVIFSNLIYCANSSEAAWLIARFSA